MHVNLTWEQWLLRPCSLYTYLLSLPHSMYLTLDLYRMAQVIANITPFGYDVNLYASTLTGMLR